MANTVYTDKQQQTASGKGSPTGKWGKLLYQVETDRKRVGLEMLLRAAASAFVVLLTLSRGTSLMLAAIAVFVVFSLWPLLHMGDKMEFYENGILHLGNWYPVGRQTRVSWEGRRGFFLPITWMDTGGGRINVSFMKDAEKLFNRAYNNAIYERGE